MEIAPAGPLDGLLNALLSDFPITLSTIWTAALLSGDDQANDLTRYLPEVRVDVSGQGHLLALVSAYLKPGWENSDEFRRVMETLRLRQIASAASRKSVPLIMMGDMNADSGVPP